MRGCICIICPGTVFEVRVVRAHSASKDGLRSMSPVQDPKETRTVWGGAAGAARMQNYPTPPLQTELICWDDSQFWQPEKDLGFTRCGLSCGQCGS